MPTVSTIAILRGRRDVDPPENISTSALSKTH
jgi:hypothetical protein